jgi:hypothetical protein
VEQRLVEACMVYWRNIGGLWQGAPKPVVGWQRREQCTYVVEAFARG